MLKTKTTYTLSPGEQKSLELIPSEETDAQEQIGLVEPTVKFEKLGLGLTSTLDKLTKNKTTTLLAINTTEVPLYIRQDSPVATFEIITPEQARYLIPLEPKLLPSSDSKKTKKISKIYRENSKRRNKSYNNKTRKRILVSDPRNQSRHIQDECS